MAESKKITADELIEKGIFDNTTQSAKALESELSKLVVGFEGIIKANEEFLRMNKNPQDSKSIKSTTAAIVESEKARRALLQTEKIAEQVKREQIKTNEALKKSRKELTNEEINALGTLEKLTYQNKKLTEERKKLNLETQSGQIRLREINKTLDENNVKITQNLDQDGKRIKNIGNYKSAFEALPGPLGNAANSVQTLSNSFKLLLANPVVLIVGAIVGAIYGLYKAITSTDSGATELAARMEQLSAIFDVVRQRAVLIAQGIGNLFTGNLTASTDKFAQSVSGVSDQLTKATKAAYEYTYALDKIEDSENNYISNRADNERKISELEFKAADKSYTIKQRRDFLIESIKIAENEAQINKKFAKDRLVAEAIYLGKLNGLTGAQIINFIRLSDSEQENASESLKTARNNNEAKFKELEELYSKMVKADTDFFNENKKNNARITAFDDQVSADKKAKQSAIDKENEAKRAKQIEDEKQANKESTFNLNEQLKEKQSATAYELKQSDDAIAAKEKEFREKKELEERYAADIKKAKQDAANYEKEQRDKIIKGFNDITNALESEIARENQLRAENAQRQIDKNRESVSRQLELAKQGLDNQLAYEEQQLAKSELKKRDIEAKAAKEKEIIQLTQAYFNALNAELSKPGADATLAPTKALADVLLARGIAKGLVQFFAEGTDYVDGPGNETSDSIPAMLSKGEGVVTARANRENRGVVKALNDGEFADMYMPKYQFESAANNLNNGFAENVLNSILLQQQRNEMYLEKIANKPVQTIDVDKFGNMIEIVYQNGIKTTTVHKKTRLS